MKLLRRLYRYLHNYKAWAIVAFGSMIVFAATQTMLMGLIRPLFDEVRAIAHERAALPLPVDTRPARARATVPYLNEPWYC